MYRVCIISLILISISASSVFAYDAQDYPKLWRAWGKQQIITKDAKGNKQVITPNFDNYAERNMVISEKVVAIYNKRSPAYGYRYVLHTPVRMGKNYYVGYHRVTQRTGTGYTYEPIPDGGEGSETPCFKTIQEAKHYYYPQWY